MAAHFKKAAFTCRLDRALAPLRSEFEERFREIAQELRESPDLDVDVPPLGGLVRDKLNVEPDQTWRAAVAAIATDMEQGG